VAPDAPTLAQTGPGGDVIVTDPAGAGTEFWSVYSSPDFGGPYDPWVASSESGDFAPELFLGGTYLVATVTRSGVVSGYSNQILFVSG
jgi:hypothetical protein